MNKVKLFLLLPLLCLPVLIGATDRFSWRGATVYFLITDRFCNGDTANDANYGRINDYGNPRLNAATFHGGDFKGVLQKAQEGYFAGLGVDVVWLTDVYEQIHGWMSGSGPVNDFPHYGYHGYYPLDYTQTDKNYGTVAELRALVDCLHAQNIRVMLGANLNNPGYPTLLDAVQYRFAPVGNLTETAAAQHNKEWSYDNWAARMGEWNTWYTSEWLRTPDEQWDPADPLTTTLYGLPDFKTEKTEPVSLPLFLKRKWAQEGHTNDPWVNPSALSLRHDADRAPAGWLIAWIAAWVEELGIDGFRCDIVEYVHPQCWQQLSDACNRALQRWRDNHPDDKAAAWTDHFYLTGDFDNAFIDRKPEYAAAGFQSMVNCRFPKNGDLHTIVDVWQHYADSLAAYTDWSPFSYLNNSYHREVDMRYMEDCATTLLLSPGAVQIFYGDETRRPLNEARFNVDSDQSFRSDMNWHSIDTALLAHFRRLGQIRRTHPAVANGQQITVDSHTCIRTAEQDTVLIVLCPADGTAVRVSDWFSEATMLTEGYTGQQLPVVNGCVRLKKTDAKVAVLFP